MEANAETIRRFADAFNRGDLDEYLSTLDPEVEFDVTEGYPGVRGIYRGRDGVRQWWEEWREAWEGGLVSEVEMLAERDDPIAAGWIFKASGRTSGIEQELRFWFVYWFSSDLITRVQLHWDRDEALAVAGLRR